jgi:hypothetical protein
MGTIITILIFYFIIGLIFILFILFNSTVNSNSELSFKIWSVMAYIVSITMLFIGFLSFIWGNSEYIVVRGLNFWKFSLIWSLPLTASISYLFYLKLKGFYESAKVLNRFLIMFSIGMILSFRYGGAILNGVLDQSMIQKHNQVVAYTHKKKYSRKRGFPYHIVVKSWHSDQLGWDFSVDKDAYFNAIPNFTRYEIITKAGYFNFEWVVSEELISLN